MKQGLGRRDFLKLAGLAPFGLIAPPLIKKFGLQGLMEGEKKNVLVVLFDAFSAKNISMYGYERETTPNLSKLAKRATVYHNHFAGGTFTTPGTASLLTMTLPWTHRAFNFGDEVTKSMASKSVFHAFDDYYRVGYTHNPLANRLLRQFQTDIDEYIPREKLFINNDGWINSLFSNDDDISTVAWSREMKLGEEGYSYSLFLPHLYEKYQESKIARYKNIFPIGVPNILGDNFFTIEEGIDWLKNNASEFPQPFFSYFHFMPPHSPYLPRREFIDVFANDSWDPLDKPIDIFMSYHNIRPYTQGTLAKRRARYDEFILYADSEFGRLINSLEASGLMENTWVVLTSDHGEMQERGLSGHSTPTFYQPIIRIPLMIFEPGQQTGREVHSLTSAIDVMPTLLHLTGHTMPTWAEGNLLPPFAPPTSKTRTGLFAVDAKKNSSDKSLTVATIMYVQGNYKIVYYLGYEEFGRDKEHVELFDIKADPEEMNNIALTNKEITSDLLAIVKSKLKEVNEPYQIVPG